MIDSVVCRLLISATYRAVLNHCAVGRGGQRKVQPLTSIYTYIALWCSFSGLKAIISECNFIECIANTNSTKTQSNKGNALVIATACHLSLSLYSPKRQKVLIYYSSQKNDNEYGALLIYELIFAMFALYYYYKRCLLNNILLFSARGGGQILPLPGDFRLSLLNT